MDIAKMREDLENYCHGKCCEECPLDDICSTGRYWTEEKEADIIELWKTAFPNKSIPVTEEEKAEAAETIGLKSQITQQEKAYATLMDQFNKLQSKNNGLQEAIKIKDETIAMLECNLDTKNKEIDSIKAENAVYQDTEKEHIRIIRDWERKGSEYEQKINDLQDHISQLNELIKGQADDIEALRERLESKNKEIDSKDNSQALAEKQIVKMRECIDSQNDTIHSLVEEKKELVERRIAAEKTAADAAKTEDNLLNSLNALGDSNAQLRRKNSQIISAVADLFKRIMEE